MQKPFNVILIPISNNFYKKIKKYLSNNEIDSNLRHLYC